MAATKIAVADISDMTCVFGDETTGLWVGTINLGSDSLDELNAIELNHRPEITIYGKKLQQHRDVSFFSHVNSDGTLASSGYSYSGQIALSRSATPLMEDIMAVINEKFDEEYNGILMNRYCTGLDYIGAHSDDEKGLGKSGVFAIIWGCSRTFRIRRKDLTVTTNPIVFDFEPAEYFLPPSKLKMKIAGVTMPERRAFIMWMKGDFQKLYTHEVPKRTTLKHPTDESSRMFERTSLTLRHHKI